MSRGYLQSWQRPSQKEIAKVLDEFGIKNEEHRDDASSMAEEVCLLRDEVSNLKEVVDRHEQE